MMRINIPIMLLGLLISTTQYSKALEFLVTDVNGTAYNTTTNQLDLGVNPSAKTVYVWMTYSTSDLNLINSGGGLWGGSARLTFGNFNLATVLTPTTSSILKPFNTSLGGTNWSGFQRNITSASGYAQAVFNNGVGSGGITLTDPTKVLLAAFVISPGSQVSYAGTTVTVGLAGAGNGFSYGDGTTYTPIILTNAGSLQFTVVPEPSTIAMGLISGISLLATGFYRRRQVKMTKSIV